MGKIDALTLPVVCADRHVLDEAQLQPVLPGKQGQRHHFVFGHSANADGIDLDRRKPDPARGVNPFDHLFQPVPAGQFSEPRRDRACRG